MVSNLVCSGVMVTLTGSNLPGVCWALGTVLTISKPHDVRPSPLNLSPGSQAIRDVYLICIHRHTHTRIYIYIRICMYVCMYIYIYMYIYIHVHTIIRICFSELALTKEIMLCIVLHMATIKLQKNISFLIFSCLLNHWGWFEDVVSQLLVG